MNQFFPGPYSVGVPRFGEICPLVWDKLFTEELQGETLSLLIFSDRGTFSTLTSPDVYFYFPFHLHHQQTWWPHLRFRHWYKLLRVQALALIPVTHHSLHPANQKITYLHLLSVFWWLTNLSLKDISGVKGCQTGNRMEIVSHGGTVVSTAASQCQGPEFNSGLGWLCGVCTFSPICVAFL